MKQGNGGLRPWADYTYVPITLYTHYLAEICDEG